MSRLISGLVGWWCDTRSSAVESRHLDALDDARQRIKALEEQVESLSVEKRILQLEVELTTKMNEANHARINRQLADLGGGVATKEGDVASHA